MTKASGIVTVLLIVCLGPILAGESGPGLGDRAIERDTFTGQPLFPFHSTHVLIRFSNPEAIASIDAMLEQFGSRRIDPAEIPRQTNYFRIRVPEGKTAELFIAELKNNPKVRDVQLDYFCRKLGEPNDPYYRYQWNFDLLDVPKAWDLTAGGRDSISVAILDTGVAYEDYGDFSRAPDLAGTRFVHPYDFVNSDTHANDDEGHGTHVAGTIAQTTNNTLGVAGIAFGCAIMPIKILDNNGVGSSYSLAEGIAWAVENGASVINMSLGFPVGVNPGRIVEDEIEKAYRSGVICVAAAGNDADDYGYSGGLEYPGAYPECVCVGSIRYDQKRAYYSNYGNGLDCVAPGGDVRVDQNRDGYGDGILQQTMSPGNPTAFEYYFYQGTSMATPHVAAAAALFKSRRGGGPVEFMDAIAGTSRDLGASGLDPEFGYGLIDLLDIIKRGQGWGADS